MPSKKIITVIVPLVAVSACSLPKLPDVKIDLRDTMAEQRSSTPETEPRTTNPTIEASLAAKRAEGRSGKYPSLSDMPKQLPAEYDSKTISEYNNALAALRSSLIQQVSNDREQAIADAAVTTQLFEEGVKIDASLEEAAKLVRASANLDTAERDKIQRQSLPKLGGQPPRPTE